MKCRWNARSAASWIRYTWNVMFVADRPTPTTAVDNYININRINAARWRQTGYGRDRNRCACRCDHTRRTTHGGSRLFGKKKKKKKKNNNLFISIFPDARSIPRLFGGKISEQKQKQTDVVEPILRILPPDKGEKNVGRFKTCFENENRVLQTFDTWSPLLPLQQNRTRRTSSNECAIFREP